MKVALHACCGPCASACVPMLCRLGHEVTLVFANSNLDSREEFERRRQAAATLAGNDGVRMVTLEYDHEDWLRKVAAGYELEPEKGERCERCFRYNLEKAAQFAAANGIPSFTTSLSVSPHKVSQIVFAAGVAAEASVGGKAAFLKEDFKKHEGFKVSVRRATELGLYRQSYCGCEFSKSKFGGWRLHHAETTVSTNLDARSGEHGDVFTADFQTAGRGRLDHQWHSCPKNNLMMSAVLSVSGLDAETISTFPLVAGLSVVKALARLASGKVMMKWPNDIWIDGKKVAGILCERSGDNIIVGIGINVKEREFPSEIADRATSLALSGAAVEVDDVLRLVLRQLGANYGQWRRHGFVSMLGEIAAVDAIKGHKVAILQTDGDRVPTVGTAMGIAKSGALVVDGREIFAGEVHVNVC